MSNLKDIRRRITSVKNTKQITRAMKLVSAAKLKKAQDSATQGRAFADNLETLTRRLIAAAAENLNNPLFEKRDISTRRVIVVGGDRGLCGPYNSNMEKALVAKEIKSNDGLKRQYVVFGRRISSLARKHKLEVVSTHENLSEDISTWNLLEVINQAIADFIDGKCDEVVIYYTKFVSAMNQLVEESSLLPFLTDQFSSEEDGQELVQIKFDPSPEKILENIVPLYLQTKLAQGCFESKASEHAARMTAMDSATRNADELIDGLVLTYNRLRQGAITKELLDIVGGAEAVSN